MIFNPDIFRAYDIRGLYGQEFDDEFAYQFGIVLVEFLQARKIVIAHDMRDTSATLAGKMIEGITHAGCDVVNIGVTSTPLCYFGVINEGADGGVMITASHLGDEYNGFKPVGKDAVVIGGDNDNFDILKQMLRTRRVEPLMPKGKVISKDIKADHTEAVIKASGIKPMQFKRRVKLEANSMIVDELGAILLELGVTMDYNNPDIIFTCDPDGDRIQVGDKDNIKVRGDILGAIIARSYFKGQAMVHDVKFSHSVLDYVKHHNITPILSKTGHAFIKQTMRDNDAEFGAEFSGHYMFKAMGFVESVALTMVLILYLLEITDTDAKTLTSSIDSWFNSGEIEYGLSELPRSMDEILAEFKEKYPEGGINELDGVDITYPDWRMLIRPSSTHPAVICIVEAKTKELFEQKKQELIDLLTH
ncbi:MAG: hypothetical protein ABH833_02300 [Parcubacteria group bacterium]